MNTLKIIAGNCIVLEYPVNDKKEAYEIIDEVLENDLANFSHKDIEVYYNGVKAEEGYYEFNLID